MSITLGEQILSFLTAAQPSTDIPYLLALTLVNGLGPRTLKPLLERWSAEQLWTLPAHFHQEAGLTEALSNSLLKAQQNIKPQQLLETYQNLGIQIITQENPLYPPLLQQIYDPPTLLFVRGNAKAMVGKTLAFVGTRRVSDYGRRVVEKLISELAGTGVCIVSGLAQGVDGAAHQMALKTKLPTVAVFGCGIDVIYPSSHKKLAQEILEAGGALVSEYPLGIQPTPFGFPQRNRIIAGLSYGSVIVEGPIKSGSLITARCALDENRSVYAVPGNMFNPGAEGPLYLIKNGAVPVTEANDILLDLKWQPTQTKAHQKDESAATSSGIELTPEQKLVLEATGYEPTAVDKVQQSSGLDSAQVGQILTLLELYGLITALPGAKVCRK